MPDLKEDWTALLTEEERRNLFNADVYRHDDHYPRFFAALATVATLRALVEEKDKALEYLLVDVGPCIDEPGASCSQHPWAGVARCSTRDAAAALALTEADMRERLSAVSSLTPPPFSAHDN